MRHRQGISPVSYTHLDVYKRQEDTGFATKLVVGEDGKVTCEYKNDDGTLSYGAYDMVPIVDAFIEQHPDFSYRGAKGILALTGYNLSLIHIFSL